MGASQKLQNSIQILIILRLVYPIHTNSLFQVIFEELPFCHFPPLKTSILERDSQIQLIFHLNIFSFSNKRKTTILFPSPLMFLQLPIATAGADIAAGSKLPPKCDTAHVRRLHPAVAGNLTTGVGMFCYSGYYVGFISILWPFSTDISAFLEFH